MTREVESEKGTLGVNISLDKELKRSTYKSSIEFYLYRHNLPIESDTMSLRSMLKSLNSFVSSMEIGNFTSHTVILDNR